MFDREDKNELADKESMELYLRAWVSSRTKSSQYNLSTEEFKFCGYEKFLKIQDICNSKDFDENQKYEEI